MLKTLQNLKPVNFVITCLGLLALGLLSGSCAQMVRQGPELAGPYAFSYKSAPGREDIAKFYASSHYETREASELTKARQSSVAFTVVARAVGTADAKKGAHWREITVASGIL